MASFKKVVLLPYEQYIQLLKSANKEFINKPPKELDNITERSVSDLLLQDNLQGLQREGAVDESEEYSDSITEDIIPIDSKATLTWQSDWEPI